MALVASACVLEKPALHVCLHGQHWLVTGLTATDLRPRSLQVLSSGPGSVEQARGLMGVTGDQTGVVHAAVLWLAWLLYGEFQPRFAAAIALRQW